MAELKAGTAVLVKNARSDQDGRFGVVRRVGAGGIVFVDLPAAVIHKRKRGAAVGQFDARHLKVLGSSRRKRHPAGHMRRKAKS